MTIGDINRELKKLIKRQIDGEDVMHTILSLMKQRENLLRTRKFKE
jgi:hypothetical protein